MNTLLIALASIALSVAAQFSLKAGMSSAEIGGMLRAPIGLHSAVRLLSNGYILGGFAMYGFGAILWLGVLHNWDVSKAYPFVGLGFVLAVIIGVAAGEQVTPARMLGVTLICLGVLMISRT